MCKDVYVFAEQRDGNLQKVGIELIGEARKLADDLGQNVVAVLLGNQIKDKASELIAHGADKVVVVDDEMLAEYVTEPYAKAMMEIIQSHNPEIVLYGATSIGRDLAPRVSARIHTGLTADCTKLDIDEETKLLMMTRPAFGGNIMAQISITKSRPQFATVRYRVMDAAQKVDNAKGEVVVCPVKEEMKQSPIEILKSEVIEKTKNIEDEDVLVVAGRGVRNEKDVEMCEELAKALGGQLAFTRPMIENGFGDVAHQVGLSGRTVRPKLIITCGVSGAIQFTSCMTGSECIVAINNDPEAQIFNVAHYCIVDELYLTGQHNLYNSLAAGISANLAGITKEDIRKALSDFQGVEHRLEKVARVRGIDFINDSKATNVNYCWYALQSMTTKTV